MGDPDDARSLDALLAEQIDYYSARAPEYLSAEFEEVNRRELEAAADRFTALLRETVAGGDVLELACGPGTWTELLLERANSLTALDASVPMLELAAERIRDDRVRFVQADAFSWTPDRGYDLVFFGFWLSHIPTELFEPFWETVATALRPRGRVMFIDDGFRTEEELIEGRDSYVIRRRLHDGTAFRAVKVPHDPDRLQQHLSRLGWTIEIQRLPGPFFYGSGHRA